MAGLTNHSAAAAVPTSPDLVPGGGGAAPATAVCRRGGGEAVSGREKCCQNCAPTALKGALGVVFSGTFGHQSSLTAESCLYQIGNDINGSELHQLKIDVKK